MVLKKLKKGFEVEKLIKIQSEIRGLINYTHQYKMYFIKETYNEHMDLVIEVKDKELKNKYNYQYLCEDSKKIIEYLDNNKIIYYIYKKFGGWSYNISLYD